MITATLEDMIGLCCVNPLSFPSPSFLPLLLSFIVTFVPVMTPKRRDGVDPVINTVNRLNSIFSAMKTATANYLSDRAQCDNVTTSCLVTVKFIQCLNEHLF